LRRVKIDRKEIFELIETERERQDRLHPIPNFKRSKNPDIEALETMILSGEFLSVLVEELGEVGRALQGEGELKEELVHTASVCVRWLENIK
jgi:hypothetical protein